MNSGPVCVDFIRVLPRCRDAKREIFVIDTHAVRSEEGTNTEADKYLHLCGKENMHICLCVAVINSRR